MVVNMESSGFGSCFNHGEFLDPVEELASDFNMAVSPDPKWGEECKGLIAHYNGWGIVVFAIGAALEEEIHQLGSSSTCDLGLDLAPEGLSVWVGHMAVVECGGYETREFELEAQGEFRSLTSSEWLSLELYGDPWHAERDHSLEDPTEFDKDT